MPLLLCGQVLMAQPVPGIQANNALRNNGDTITICQGRTIVYQSLATGATSVQWRFKNGTPATALGAGPVSVTYNTVGIDSTIQVVSDGSQRDSMYLFVRVSDEKPIPGFNFAPDNVCGNIPINFTNTTTGNGLSFLWNYGDGNTSTVANPSYQFLNAIGVSGTTTYSVKLIATNSIGCRDSISRTVTIRRVPDASIGNAEPTVTFLTFNGVPTFRKCSNIPSSVFQFINQSTTIATNVRYTIKWGDASPDSIFTSWPTGVIISHVYPLGNRILTVEVEGPDGCIGIKRYNVFLGSNPGGGLTSPGNTDVCTADSLRFVVRDIGNNPPGTLYSFLVNDGTAPQVFTHPPPDTMRHLFTIGSCTFNSSSGNQTYSNAFGAYLTISNPCGSTSPSVVPIYVSGRPRAQMEILPSRIVCTNTPVVIRNVSGFGGVVTPTGGTSSICSLTGKQVWVISPATGYTIVGATGSLNNNPTNSLVWTSGASVLNLNFNTPGTYTIKLYIGNDRCGIDSTTQTICVRLPPQAAFTMSNRLACDQGATVITNTSPASTCGGDLYNWTVTRLDPQLCGSGGSFTFINGTNASSANPQIQFTGGGRYVITLTTSAALATPISCPPAIARDTFTVRTRPRVVINPITAVCVNNTISPTAVIATCYDTSAITYNWTFTGGTPGSSTTVVPGAVNYVTAGSYPVILEATNSCGSASDTEIVQITPPPVANAGADIERCSGDTVTIGTPGVAGITYTWTPATGLSNAAIARPVLSFTYTGPSADTLLQYVVTAAAGSNCRSTDTLLVRIKKRPVIAVTGLPLTVCAGDSAVLTASGGVSYTWTPAATLNMATGAVVIARPVATTTYTVTGIENGCSSTATVTITVNNFLPVNAGPDTTICNNLSAVQLTGTPAGGNWTGNGITASGVFNAQAVGNGTFTVYYTAGANSCLRTDSAIVTVTNPPIAQVGNDTTVCQSNIAFTLTGSPAGGSWSGTALVTTGGQFTPSAAGSYTVVYTRGSGSCIARDTMVVNVGGGVTNNTIAPNQAICINTQPAIITGSVASGGNGVAGYSWEQSTNNINWSPVLPAVNTVNYTPPVLSVTTYYRRIATTSLCPGSLGSTSTPVMITVNPDARAVFTATDTIRCSPFVLGNVITVTPFPAGNATYTWYANGVLIGSNATGIFPGYTIAAPGETVIIKLVTTSPFGCKPDSIQRTFITTTAVTAGFTKDRTAGCDTLKVTFTNTSAPLGAAFQYFWNFGNGSSFTGQQPGTINYLSSPSNRDTTYYITLKAFNGCDTTYWRDSVRVRANPRARFNVDTTFGCSPFTVRITNTSLGGPATYYWDFDNGTRDTTTTLTPFSITYNVGATDTFNIRLIAENECKRDTTFLRVVVAPNAIQPQISINGNQLFNCAPATVVFNNATTGATSLLWNFGDGSAAVTTTPQQTQVPHTYTNPGQFTVSIRIRNGCSDTTVFRQVTVLARPVAGFTTNGSSFCAGDTVRVTNTSVNADAYRWDWGDGTVSPLANPTHVYATGGTYTITLRADRVINQGIVCSDIRQQVVTVINKPAAVISSNIAPVNCIPFTLRVSATGLGNETATWVITDTTAQPSAISVTGGTAQYTFNKPGTFSVRLRVTNAAGCTDSVTISFVVSNKATAAFTPASISTCRTDTVITHTNNSTYTGIDPLQYRWLVDNQLIASGTNFTYQYQLGAAPLPRTFQTSLIVINQAGCRDTARGTVVMQAAPQSLFTFVNPNTCVPFNLQVSNTSIQATQYRWVVNGVVVSTQANPLLPITLPATNYTISLITENQFGCKPDTLTRSFTTLAKPTAAFTVSDSLSCSGSLNVTMINQSTGATSYAWNWSDGSPGSNFTNPTHLYTFPGQYPIILIARDGVCADTATRTVRVANRPAVNFDVNKSNFCGNDSVRMINLSSGAASYLWDFGDGSTSTLTNPVHWFTQRATPYTIKLVATGQFGCKDSAVRANLIVARLLPGAGFSVSPAPVINVPNYTFSFINTTLQNNNHQYLWTFGDGSLPVTSRNAAHRYADTGSYTVKLGVFDAVSNCRDTAVRVVRITGFPGYLYVPNAFQPGSLQPILKTFLPLGRGLKSYRLQILTTWGQKVFETSSLDATGAPNQGWNGQYNGGDNYNTGKSVQQDVYVWRIDAVFLNGTEWPGMLYPGEDRPKRVGTITIIR